MCARKYNWYINIHNLTNAAKRCRNKKKCWYESQLSSELNEVSLNWFDRCVYIGITLSVFDTWLGRRLNVQRWCSSILYYRNPFGIASFNGRMYVSEWVSERACVRSRSRSLAIAQSLCISVSFILVRPYTHAIRYTRTYVCMVMYTKPVFSVFLNECSMRVVKMISKCFSVHCQILIKILPNVYK